MIRRQFIQKVAGTATAGLTVGALGAEEGETATFLVKGFTCVTCAVGLEVVLRQQDGIRRAKASYPDGKVVVMFQPSVISAKAIKEFINKTTGFKVAGEKEQPEA